MVPGAHGARHVVLGAALVLIVAILATSIVSALLLRAREIESWRRQLSDLSLVLAEQTDQTMSSAQLAMDSIAERIEAMRIRSEAELRTKAATEAMHQVLRDKIAGVPHVDVATIVAANGDVINFTRAYPAPPINLTDRDYFQARRDQPGLGLFVSTPVRNKGNGKWVYYLSRRLDDPGGQFLGLVIVGISVDQFTDFYGSVGKNLGEGAAISLYRRDFTVLTRWPRQDDTIGRQNLTGASHLIVEEMKKTDDVVYTTIPRFSEAGRPTARLVAVRFVPRFPMMVILTVTEDLFLASWRQAVIVIAGVATGSSVALLIAAFVLLRIVRQREESAALLREVADRLQQSEARLKEAQQLAHLGSWELDIASGVMTWSDETHRIFEVAPDKFGRSLTAFLDAIHPEDRGEVEAAYRQSLLKHQLHEVEHRVALGDGRVKYVLEQFRHFYGADGTPTRSVGTVEDVTERALANELLRESEERFRTIADHTADWEYWQGPDRQFIYMSPSCQIVTGYTPLDFVSDGQLIHRIVHPDDRDLMIKHLRDIESEDECSMEFRIVRRDGEVRWIAHQCRQVLSNGGEKKGRRVSNRDVTDRKAAEIELRSTTERLEQAMEASNLALWDFDIAAGRVYLDEHWAGIVGGEGGERVAPLADMVQAIHPEDRERVARAAMDTVKGATPRFREEMRIKAVGGEWKWITCRGKVVERNADGWALRAVGTNTDITKRKLAEFALAASEMRYRALFESAPLGIALTNVEGTVIAANETMSRMFGYRLEDLSRINIRSLYGNLAERDVLLRRVREEHAVHGYELELRRRDGSMFFGSLTVKQLDDGQGGTMLSMWEDITARKQAQKELQDSEARFRDIVDHSPIGMMISSLDGRVIQANRALCTMLGYERGELEQLSFRDITHPDDRVESEEQFQKLVSGKAPRYQIEKRYLRKDGKPVWTQLTASLLRHVGDASSYVLGQIEDITESRLWREQMFHQAYYDPLTDLPNRRLLLDRVNQALGDAHRNGRSAAILFLDLDHFKEINDSLGHDVGDRLLREVAGRLKGCVRRGDTVSRQGGDEFVIVLTDMEQPQDASLISRKILEALGVPIRIEGHLLTITTSIGISLYPEDATEDGYELIKKADEAMYAAKQEGRNRHRYYHETAEVLGE